MTTTKHTENWACYVLEDIRIALKALKMQDVLNCYRLNVQERHTVAKIIYEHMIAADKEKK